MKEKTNYLINKFKNKIQKDSIGILKVYLVQEGICIMQEATVLFFK